MKYMYYYFGRPTGSFGIVPREHEDKFARFFRLAVTIPQVLSVNDEVISDEVMNE